MGLLFEDSEENDLRFATTANHEDLSVEVPDSPERQLFLAVLFDGIQTYITHSKSSSTEGRRKFKEAHTWIVIDESEYIFSFDNLCDAIGVNADYLRAALLRSHSFSGDSLD